MKSKKVTFADIAEYTGFSKTTISRYFNNPDSLTLENQQKVADALIALDYKENKVGRILASGRTEFVGIIIPNLYMHYYSEMLNQILDTYEKYGYKFLVFAGNEKADVERRYIEERDLRTRWSLTGSADGETYEMLADRSQADTDLTHDLIVWEEGKQLRYLKLTVYEVPYGQQPCISGLRVFGIQKKDKPDAPEFTAERVGDLDMSVQIHGRGAVGYNILWGEDPQKLYHSYMVFHPKQRIGALIKGRDYWVRVDAFNEAGITEGNVKRLV